MKDYELNPAVFLRAPVLDYSTLYKQTIDDSFLRTFASNKLFDEAVLVASRSFHNRMRKWVKGEVKNPSEEKQIRLTVLKYLSRMCTRSTPFGLFAGVVLGHWDKETMLNMSDERLQKTIRLDMLFLDKLFRRLIKLPEVQDCLNYFPNPTIYHIYGEIRFIETTYKEDSRDYKLSAIDELPEISYLLTKAKSGLNKKALVTVLEQQGVEPANRQEVIDELLESQILVSDMDVSVTGGDAVSQFKELLKQKPALLEVSRVQEFTEMLTEIQHLFLTTANHRIDPNFYQELRKITKPFLDLEEHEIPCQVDAHWSGTKPTLNISQAGKLRKTVTLLDSVIPRYDHRSIHHFKKALVDRYEYEEKPLLEVLDKDAGIGYPVKGDTFRPGLNSNLKKLNSAVLQGLIDSNYTVDITNIQFDKKDYSQDFPDTFSVLGSVLSENSDQALYLNLAIGGSSGANLINRFAYIDPEIEMLSRELTEIEKRLSDHKIVAEVLHVPQARLGNVLMRPDLQEFEIPFLTQSNKPVSHQIIPSDLYISVDQYTNELVLRSKRLGKSVMPRIGNAHNFSFRNLSLYRFLGDFQFMDLRYSLKMDRGIIEIDYPFHPRITAHQVIISRANWQFRLEDLAFLKKKDFSLDHFYEWKSKWKIPDRVVMIEGDNELYLDFSLKIFVELFLSEISKRKVLLLAEFLEVQPGENGQKGKHHLNEFIASFTRKSKKDRPSEPQKIPAFDESQNLQRAFGPGSEWIYYKLYLAPKLADRILAECLKPLVKDLRDSSLIKKWHFIRYNDPDFHLRVRFNLVDQDQYEETIMLVNKTLRNFYEDGILRSVQTHDYVREIERYGSWTPAIEELAGRQSQWIADFIHEAYIQHGNVSEKTRFQASVWQYFQLMKAFDIDDSVHVELTGNSFRNFKEEFRIGVEQLRKLKKENQKKRQWIQEVWDNDRNSGLNWKLNFVSGKNFEDGGHHYIKEKNLQSPLSILEIRNMIWNLFHLFVNRVYIEKARWEEFLIYMELSQFLKSILRKEKES